MVLSILFMLFSFLIYSFVNSQQLLKLFLYLFSNKHLLFARKCLLL